MRNRHKEEEGDSSHENNYHSVNFQKKMNKKKIFVSFIKASWRTKQIKTKNKSKNYEFLSCFICTFYRHVSHFHFSWFCFLMKRSIKTSNCVKANSNCLENSTSLEFYLSLNSISIFELGEKKKKFRCILLLFIL